MIEREKKQNQSICFKNPFRFSIRSGEMKKKQQRRRRTSSFVLEERKEISNLCIALIIRVRERTERGTFSFILVLLWFGLSFLPLSLSRWIIFHAFRFHYLKLTFSLYLSCSVSSARYITSFHHSFLPHLECTFIFAIKFRKKERKNRVLNLFGYTFLSHVFSLGWSTEQECGIFV